MNSLAWIGVIIWGILITAFGLAAAGTPAGASPDVQAQDVLFLVTGGLVTCLIGVAGLFGLMGWIPGLRKEPNGAA
ncbi:hypothetical protein [Massilia horti]|uniref:Uncharacterized protein n=1 Tax=Massilia horti TaxID=2562153 RepID=A0A4Y9T9D4_9BURK|nr:hypothetical protein [Massilia horti]TFW36056.1 hypothetical protein E4O92_00690 [Massilia horti]